ncbi:hypothetical protein H2200_011905 [Cladophialophora chaetospira]|uniref:Zn(2)-C6 fungal-type domain-containing protein n=1 Tax=Cladophialophora chaetospira TaxID=386627 RepID=A0AA38WYX9_9EURO|nr:hypothetical protein H2200_011905 [Cladophialophora chaetospira]
MSPAKSHQTEKRMTCVACTKAKRKCDKGVPECRRCIVKGQKCRYPAPRIKPAYDIIYAEDGAATMAVSTEAISASSASTELLALSQTAHSREELPNIDQDHRPTCSGLLSDPWFLAPSSWIIDHKLSGTPGTITFGEEALFHFIEQLLAWLKQWTADGHCPLFHRRLYNSDLPPCVAQAYSALVAYQNRTPATERLVMRLIERHVNQLLQDHQLEQTQDGLGAILYGTSDHLARTQALLVYKIIRLFDGDIRSRAEAESHISTLALWAGEMWQSAAVDASVFETAAEAILSPVGVDWEHEPEYIETAAAVATPTGGCRKQLHATAGDLTSTWEAWVFAESIRRTFLIATLIEAVYLTLKQGWGPCRGGIIFSGGAGLWDAPWPSSWVERTRKNKVFRVRCTEARKLFGEARPSDVDEFSRLILIVSFGLERFEQWSVEQGHNYRFEVEYGHCRLRTALL